MRLQGVPYWTSGEKVINFVAPTYSSQDFVVHEDRIYVFSRPDSANPNQVFVYSKEDYTLIGQVSRPTRLISYIFGDRLISLDGGVGASTNGIVYVSPLENPGEVTTYDFSSYLNQVQGATMDEYGFLYMADSGYYGPGEWGRVLKINTGTFEVEEIIVNKRIVNLTYANNKFYALYSQGSGMAGIQLYTYDFELQREYTPIAGVASRINPVRSDYVLIYRGANSSSYYINSISDRILSVPVEQLTRVIKSGYYLHTGYTGTSERGLYTLELSTVDNKYVAYNNLALEYTDAGTIVATQIVMDVAFDYDSQTEYYLSRNSENLLRIERRDMTTHTLLSYSDMGIEGNPESRIFFYKDRIFFIAGKTLYKVNPDDLSVESSLLVIGGAGPQFLTSMNEWEDNVLLIGRSGNFSQAALVDVRTMEISSINIGMPVVDMEYNGDYLYVLTTGAVVVCMDRHSRAIIKQFPAYTSQQSHNLTRFGSYIIATSSSSAQWYIIHKNSGTRTTSLSNHRNGRYNVQTGQFYSFQTVNSTNIRLVGSVLYKARNSVLNHQYG